MLIYLSWSLAQSPPYKLFGLLPCLWADWMLQKYKGMRPNWILIHLVCFPTAKLIGLHQCTWSVLAENPRGGCHTHPRFAITFLLIHSSWWLFNLEALFTPSAARLCVRCHVMNQVIHAFCTRSPAATARIWELKLYRSRNYLDCPIQCRCAMDWQPDVMDRRTDTHVSSLYLYTYI